MVEHLKLKNYILLQMPESPKTPPQGSPNPSVIGDHDHHEGHLLAGRKMEKFEEVSLGSTVGPNLLPHACTTVAPIHASEPLKTIKRFGEPFQELMDWLQAESSFTVKCVLFSR